jgi:hypothetical protein
MRDVIFDCEKGKRFHQYHPLIKYSLQEIAEKTGLNLGYHPKVEQFGHTPPDTMLNPTSEQSGICVSVAQGREFIFNGIVDHWTKS